MALAILQIAECLPEFSHVEFVVGASAVVPRGLPPVQTVWRHRILSLQSLG